MPNEVAFADHSALARNHVPKPRITRRVKNAVDIILETGKPYNEAATEVGLTTRAMRLALDKPHVVAYMRNRLQVLRALRSPRNFHRLCEIADAENNMPAVNAIKALEGISDEQTNKPSQASPGVTIRIVNVGGAPVEHARTTIDAKADEC